MSLIPSVVVVVVALLFLNVSVFFVFVTVPCVGLPLLFFRFISFSVFFSKILPGVALFDGDGSDDYRGWLCMS